MDLMEMRMRQQPHHWCADMVPEKRIDLPVLPPVTSQAGWRQHRIKRKHHENHTRGFKIFNPNLNKLENDQKNMLLQLPWSYAEAVKKPNNKQANLSLSKDEDQMEDQSEKSTVGVNGANSNGQDMDEDSPLNPDAMEFIPIATSSDKDEMTVSATTTTTDNENEDVEPLEENQLKPLPVDTLKTISASGNNSTETKIIDEVNGNIQIDDGDVNILDQESCEVKEMDDLLEEALPAACKQLDRAELYEANEKELEYDPFSPIPQNNDQEEKTEFNDENNETANCGNIEKNNLFGNELDFDELVKNKANYSESHFGENEFQEHLKNSSTENGEILKIGHTDVNHFSEEPTHKSFAVSVENNHSEVNKSAETPFEDEKENHLDSNSEKMESQTNGYLNEIHYEDMEIKECQVLLEQCDKLEGINISGEDLDCHDNSEKAELISSAEGFSDLSNKDVMESSLFMDENLFNESNDQNNSDKFQINSEEQPELLTNRQEEEILQKAEIEHSTVLEDGEETPNINNLNNSDNFDIDENFFSNENKFETSEVTKDIAGENIEKNIFDEIEDNKNNADNVEATEASIDTDNILNDSHDNNKENIEVKEFNLNNANFYENNSTEAENQQNKNNISDDMSSSRDETNDNDSSFEIINDCLENNVETLEHNQENPSNEEKNDTFFDTDKSLYECFNSDMEMKNQSNIENVGFLKNENLQKHFAENEESHEGFGPVIDSDVNNTFENHTESDCEQDKIILIKNSESECETSNIVYQAEFEQLMTKEDNELITSLPQAHNEAHLNNSSEDITPIEESLGSEITLQDKTYHTPQDDHVPSENTAEDLVLMNEEHTLSDQKFYEEDNINTEVPKTETNSMINEIFESNNSETIKEYNDLCKEDNLMESEQTQKNYNCSIVDDEKSLEEAEDEATNTNHIVECDQVHEVCFNEEDDKHKSGVLNKEQNYDEKYFITETIHESKESNIEEDASLKSTNIPCDPYESTVSIQETCINEQVQMLNEEAHTDEALSSEHFSEVNEINNREEETSVIDEEIVEKDLQEHKLCEAEENKEENQFADELTPDENTAILPTNETKELDIENFEIITEIKEENNDLIHEDISFGQEIENLPEKTIQKNTEINSIKEESSAFSSTSAEEIQLVEELTQVQSIQILPTNEIKESVEHCQVTDDLKEENNDLDQDLQINLKTNDSPLEEKAHELENEITKDSEVLDLKSDDILNTSEIPGTIIAAAAIATVAVGATVSSGIPITNEIPDTDKNIASGDFLTKLLHESAEEAKEKKRSTAVKSSPKKTDTQTSSPTKPSSPVSSKAKTSVGKAAPQPIKSSGSTSNAQSKSAASTTKSQSTPKATASQTKTTTIISKPGTPTTKSAGQPISSSKSAVAPIKAAAVPKTTSKPTTTTTKSSVSKPATLTKTAVSSTKTAASSNKTTTTSLTKSGAPATAKSSATTSGKPVVGGAAKSSKTPSLTNGSKPAENNMSKTIPSKPGTPTSKPSTPTTKSTISAKPSAAKPTSGTMKLSASSTTAKPVGTKPSSPTTKTSSTPTKTFLSNVSKVAPTKSSGDASKMSSSKTSTIKPSTPPSKPTLSKLTSAVSKSLPITKKPGSPVKTSVVTSSVTKSSVSEVNGNKSTLKSSVNGSVTKTTLKAPAPKGGLTKQVTDTTDKGKVAPNKTSPSSVKKSPNAVKKLTTSDKNSKNVSKSPTHQKDQVVTKEDEAVTSTTEDFPIEKSFVIENLPPQISV